MINKSQVIDYSTFMLLCYWHRTASRVRNCTVHTVCIRRSRLQRSVVRIKVFCHSQIIHCYSISRRVLSFVAFLPGNNTSIPDVALLDSSHSIQASASIRRGGTSGIDFSTSVFRSHKAVQYNKVPHESLAAGTVCCRPPCFNASRVQKWKETCFVRPAVLHT